MNHLHKVFFSLAFIFFTLHSYSQEIVPLRSFLEGLEEAYPFRFSFKDADVAPYYIKNQTFASSEEALSYVRNRSLFDFIPIEGNTLALRFSDATFFICGTVYDQETAATFSKVLVATPYQKVVTEADGTFNLRVKNANDPVQFEFTGYHTLRLDANYFSKRPCQPIFLSQKIEQLSTVTLSNYLAKGISKNADGSLTVNYEEFDILPGLIEPDVLLTLQALPGIQSVNETVSYINIRGGTNDQNLILWDGIKMYQSGHFFGLISAFNPQLTEKVTLIKNGTTASLGDGVSGVIAMEGSQQPTKTLSMGTGMNLLSADAFADIPLGSMGSMQIAGRKSLNGLFKTPTYQAYFDRAFQNTEVTSMGADFTTSDDEFQFYDTSIRALFRPTDKDRLRVNFLILGNSLAFLENATINEEPQSLRSDLLQDNITGGIDYQHLWNDAFSTEVQAYGTAYLLEATNYDILNNQRLIQKNKIEENSITVKSTWQVTNTWTGKLGYQFLETGITNFEQINNPFFERLDKQVLRTNSLFVETQFRPFQNTFLNLGARANHVGKFNQWFLEPRFSFNHQFLKYFTFEVLGEIKSQTTSQVIDFQSDFLGVENRRWILSKPDEIPVITSRQLSAGITINRKGWLVSIEPFVKEVKGITTQSQGFQNQFQNIRTHGSYEVKGIDLLVNKRFKDLNTWLSYSYSKNDYRFEELVPNEFPNNLDIRHTFTFGCDYRFNRFNLAAGLNWHSGRPTTLLVEGNEVVEGNLNFSEPNLANIDDYIRFDVSGTYRFSLGGKSEWFAGVSIWNLLDRQNTINHFFRLNEEAQIEEVDEYALRFTPNISIRVML